MRGTPRNATVWNLTGKDVAWIRRDTRDNAQPVRPPSVHANLKIFMCISVGQRSMLGLELGCETVGCINLEV